ncbi:MAG: SDR family NAD(P)-dependent oxidoreductase [Chakrabartia sp.]
MKRLFIFGLGYAASYIARAALHAGFDVVSTGSAGTLRFDDHASVRLALASSSHVLSSVPPMADGDPVLTEYGDVLQQRPELVLAYLSSTGVYGDAGGAWVDETAPIKGRRANRNDADQHWLALGARVYRLPGIYGPGRSALDRVAEGRAHRIALPDQVFSRIHVADIASGVMRGFEAPPGAYNLADDHPGPQNDVIAYACAMLGLPTPPLQTMDEANLSPMARAFYAENRRVANGKAKRVLGWAPLYPDYVSGLAACHAGR